ncbi:Ig-like domain-containing protein [Nocardioides sp. SYSU D00038]|uniref:Ig-like domain-containing protein n=1 Tax=Nocardioides sp. SYSU D00038 TaxID=2812554 RepID=UPI0019688D8F|nr:Ig-like domain-containing protein [Nocardioides sp. SYSU D00038]
MKKLLLALLATLVATAGLLAPSTPASAAGEWQDGKSDSDIIYDCWLKQPRTGVSANVGWRTADNQVPEVGETFYVRGYIGLIGMPCSEGVNVVPQLVLPAGLEFAEGAYMWDLQDYGDSQDMRERNFTYDELPEATLIGDENGNPFFLDQGDVFEFQFPVKATRQMKGPATQRPECRKRIEGDGPCPIAESGDHFQVGFTVNGHGGDRHYVTPYVGLFVAPKGGSGGPGQPTVKAASKTTATYAVKKGKKGTATVKVTSAKVPTGQVVLLDKGKRIASGKLAAGHRGRIVLRLPKLKRGVHKLVVKYLGSSTVKPSASATRTLRVR